MQTCSTEKIPKSLFALPPSVTLINTLTQAKPHDQMAYHRMFWNCVPLFLHYHCLDFSRRVSRSSIQPSSWRVANVVPIHKKHPARLLATIHLSPCCRSLRRWWRQLEKRYSILSPCEFSFRGGLSTADLLTKLHQECSKLLGEGPLLCWKFTLLAPLSRSVTQVPCTKWNTTVEVAHFSPGSAAT